jgi:hypothetical protein
VTHEDHAVRACSRRSGCRDLVKRYAEDARRTYGVNVQIRVGLNSGDVRRGPLEVRGHKTVGWISPAQCGEFEEPGPLADLLVSGRSGGITLPTPQPLR